MSALSAPAVGPFWAARGAAPRTASSAIVRYFVRAGQCRSALQVLGCITRQRVRVHDSPLYRPTVGECGRTTLAGRSSLPPVTESHGACHTTHTICISRRGGRAMLTPKSIDVNGRPYRHELIQRLDIFVPQSHASVTHRSSDGTRHIRSVQCIAIAEVQTMRANDA